MSKILYDIYELLKKENKGDVISTLEDLKELKEETLKWDDYFWDFINKIAKENNYCPRCLVELEMKKIGKEKYEIWGSEVSEDINALVCPQCGNTYK